LDAIQEDHLRPIKPSWTAKVSTDRDDLQIGLDLRTVKTSSVVSNWSGNYAYRAATVHHPSSLGQLSELLAGADSVHALGSRHSFTGIGDAGELVALDRLAGEIAIDRAAGTVSLPGHLTYAELAVALNREGMALHNLASLPHISVAGAVSTASHGSGDQNGNLATAVVGLELVTSSGELVRARRGEDHFDGLVVGLGALGVVTRLTLAVEPSYEMRQTVFEDLGWETLFEHFDEITASGDSVSVFHRFGELTEQVWVKSRVDRAKPPTGSSELFGARAASSARHPIAGADPVNCTRQLGVPGTWSERLPHFRSGFAPSSGEELQSEFFVGRRDAVAAIRAVRDLADSIRPLLLISELRTIAADSLWLSPQSGRPTVSIHFTWQRRQPEVERVLEDIEAALVPFRARPHWAKLFTADAAAIAPQYTRMDDFRRLREQLDPRGAFSNQWLRRRVLGAA
jgi:alditol oxidase